MLINFAALFSGKAPASGSQTDLGSYSYGDYQNMPSGGMYGANPMSQMSCIWENYFRQSLSQAPTMFNYQQPPAADKYAAIDNNEIKSVLVDIDKNAFATDKEAKKQCLKMKKIESLKSEMNNIDEISENCTEYSLNIYDEAIETGKDKQLTKKEKDEKAKELSLKYQESKEVMEDLKKVLKASGPKAEKIQELLDSGKKESDPAVQDLINEIKSDIADLKKRSLELGNKKDDKKEKTDKAEE